MFVKLFEISRVKYGRRDITKTTSPVIAITLPSIFLIISKIMWKKYQFVKTTMKLVRYAKKLVFKAQKPANVIVSGWGSSRTITVNMIASTASTNASNFSEFTFNTFSIYYDFHLLSAVGNS